MQGRTTAIAELPLPTPVRLLGWELLKSRANFRHCHRRARLAVDEVRAAMAEPDCCWAHPVPRPHDAPVRASVRASVRSAHREYAAEPRGAHDCRRP